MSPALEPYASRLRADLAVLEAELDGLLDQSTIQAVNADPMFITASNWRWGRSDSALTAARMSLSLDPADDRAGEAGGCQGASGP
jgi:hypothetical protein